MVTLAKALPDLNRNCRLIVNELAIVSLEKSLSLVEIESKENH